VLRRGEELARRPDDQSRSFAHRRSAQTAADKLNAGVRFDWTTVDWWDAEAPDPRTDAPGWRNWLYYASPTMTRGAKNYAPRDFRAGTRAGARRIIAASPEARGHITKWSEHTQRRHLVDTVTPESPEGIAR
jgi:hypothetical protein